MCPYLSAVYSTLAFEPVVPTLMGTGGESLGVSRKTKMVAMGFGIPKSTASTFAYNSALTPSSTAEDSRGKIRELAKNGLSGRRQFRTAMTINRRMVRTIQSLITYQLDPNLYIGGVENHVNLLASVLTNHRAIPPSSGPL
jgi:hypothetical protein